MKKWISMLLAALLLAVLPALAEGLEIEEKPIVAEPEEIVFSEDVDNAIQEKDFMLFSDEPEEEGYADFLTEGTDNPSSVAIDAAHFPDDVFRGYVSDEFDNDGDGMLSSTEIDGIEELWVACNRITSLKGLEFFPDLIKIYCYENQLTSLDVSQNKALEELDCYSNQLTDLDVSNNTKLTLLFCDSNQLTSLDVSKNTNLTSLAPCHNKLTSLDVSQNTALRELHCEGNRLTALDLSKNKELRTIACYKNAIASLDLSGCSDELKNTLLNDRPIHDEDEHTIYIGSEDACHLWADDTTTLIVNGQIIYLGVGQKVGISFCEITVGNKTWTGKALKPVPVVKYGDKTLVKGTDYTVSYKNNTKVGTATVTVKGIGNYTGSKKVTFKIKPKATSTTKMTGGSKKITVKWTKQTKQVSGYQIQYGTKKDFSNAKTLTVSGAKTAKTTIKKLKAKKTYYVRIRTYKTVSGKKYYSSWSKSKKVKTK